MIYDLAGRLIDVDTSVTPHQPATTVGYGYDRVGNRLSMTDGTGTTAYIYDQASRLTDLTSPVGHTGYTYDGLGRRETATVPNGIVSTYTFDDSGRLLSLTNEGTSSFDYTHDNVGNRLSMTTVDGTHGYTYDGIYQLTRATHPTSPTEAFTYDGVGNRLSSEDHSSWAYDANNRLTGYNDTSYTHDENGNMVTKTDGSGTTTYEYDSENRLIRITDPESRVTTYTYDGLGRRIEKNVGGTITRYVYDLEDILFEYDGNNNITARYTHGPGIDDLIGMARGGESHFYHHDGLGSITGITDSSKQPVASYGYDAFGNIASQTGTLTNPYTYTGREYDQESGLYYYRARYYDPTIGRFLQPDPLDMAMVILIRQYFPSSSTSELLYHYALENPLIISNSYPYVANNPVNWVDPNGTIGIVPAIIIFSGTYAVTSYVGQLYIWLPLYIELDREIARTHELLKISKNLEEEYILSRHLKWLVIQQAKVGTKLGFNLMVMVYNLVPTSPAHGSTEISCETLDSSITGVNFEILKKPRRGARR
jgi:RHS repeat-associated protein